MTPHARTERGVLDAVHTIDAIDMGALAASTLPTVRSAPFASTATGRISDAVPAAEQPEPRSKAPSTPRADPVTRASAATDEAPAPEPRHVHYAFAKHLERAEQRRDDTQLFDFGEAGDSKYTFGGWLGHHTSAELHEGRTTLRLRANNLKLVLPAERDDLSQLTLSVRSFGPARMSVHLNGRGVGTLPLSGKALETVSVELDPGLLQRGDNRLELRLYNKGSAAQPGFALDYAALSAKQPVSEVPAPISHETLRPSPERDRLLVPPGLTLAYSFEVPPHASFTAAVRSDAPAHLQVRALRDAAPEQLLGSLEVGGQTRQASIDLSAFAGELVKLALRADGAVVTLDEPAITSPAEARASSERPPIRNVLLYLIDTLRADKLSPYNPHSRVRTPGLSRFLESAAVVTSARSQENWTKPSVATLLSSLLPWEHNTFSDAAVLPSSVLVLPEHLQKQGFFTGGFIANGYVSDKFGFQRGFDTYRNYIREGRRSVAQSVASDVLQWLDERPQDKPFFLYVHTIDAHVPYKPPRDFLDLYDAAPYSGPVSFARSATLLEEIKLGRLPVGPRDKERLEALYDGAISYHDVYFDAIVGGLSKRGLDGETLVVVTADHGEEFWDHGSVGHGHSLFDELLHVPLIFRVPGVTHSGDQISSNVGLVDVAPTILEALGQTPPQAMSGRSFLPELLGRTSDAPRASVSGFMTGLRSVAIGRYKLVQRGLSHSSLYDTRLDPHESQDLSAERPIALAYTRGLLGLLLARESGEAPQAPVVHTARKTEIDADTERQLRALGYVGSSRH